MGFLKSVVRKRKTFGNVELTEAELCTQDDAVEYATENIIHETQDISQQEWSQIENGEICLDIDEIVASQHCNSNVEVLVADTDTETMTPVSSLSCSRSDTPQSAESSLQHPIRRKSSNVAKSSAPTDVGPVLNEAVNTFKDFVAQRNALLPEDMSLQQFCNSLYGDLKRMSKSNLLKCKIEILQIIDIYST